ncbi:glycosyltransferase family 4 protein [Vibrio sp. A1-1]|uniref:glycosyltransferase family 4 protein n=1 Tax=Vibrio sp. A1-1 TaxID=2912250 RepID=UPI001F48B176|nr:glycosyltransferase family 4 protein [Vibrio sp. A1-1]MCF7455159.1 glycosyltransferase family 4 protein [Vibrio sp. A1-1]
MRNNKNVGIILGDTTATGGIERVSFQLAKSLKNNVHVEVLSLCKSRERELFNSGDFVIRYLTEHAETTFYNRKYKGVTAYLFDLWYLLLKSRELKKHIRETNLNYIVSCDIKMTALCLLASLCTKTKVIVIEHFEFDVPNKFLKMLRKFLYRWVHCVVIQTDEDYFKYKNILNESKINIIPNIIELKKPESVDRVKRNSIIGVGRLTNQKGFDLLISAWSLIYEKYNDWSLDIYGEGEEKENLIKLIEARNVSARTNIYPFSNQIDEVYSVSRVFVLSSRYEGLGMVLLEALSHKLPCISFDCPAGPKTIIKNGVNGLLVKTGDVNELADAIDLLLSKPDLQSLLSKNSVASLDKFTEKEVKLKWLSILGDVDES